MSILSSIILNVVIIIILILLLRSVYKKRGKPFPYESLIFIILAIAIGNVFPSLEKQSPPVVPPEPPKLEIQPSTEDIDVGRGTAKDAKGNEFPVWQFQTYITVTNPTNSPTEDAYIRTCFFTGKKDDWVGEIAKWTPECLRGPSLPSYKDIPGNKEYRIVHVPAREGFKGRELRQAPHIQKYAVKDGEHGDVMKYVDAHSPTAAPAPSWGCTAWQCLPYDRQQFKAHESIKHLVYPDLANDPRKYLCSGNNKAALFVRLIWNDKVGNRFQDARYIPIRCVPDPRGPINGKPRPKLFRWAEGPPLKKLPSGVDPPPAWCNPPETTDK